MMVPFDERVIENFRKAADIIKSDLWADGRYLTVIGDRWLSVSDNDSESVLWAEMTQRMCGGNVLNIDANINHGGKCFDTIVASVFDLDKTQPETVAELICRMVDMCDQ